MSSHILVVRFLHSCMRQIKNSRIWRSALLMAIHKPDVEICVLLSRRLNWLIVETHACIAARVERTVLSRHAEVVLSLLPDLLHFVSANGNCYFCWLKPSVRQLYVTRLRLSHFFLIWTELVDGTKKLFDCQGCGLNRVTNGKSR